MLKKSAFGAAMYDFCPTRRPISARHASAYRFTPTRRGAFATDARRHLALAARRWRIGQCDISAVSARAICRRGASPASAVTVAAHALGAAPAPLRLTFASMPERVYYILPPSSFPPPPQPRLRPKCSIYAA